MRLLMRLLNLFSTERDRAEVARQHEQRRPIDERIHNLECATIDGDPKWMLELVRRDPACALRIAKECNKTDAAHR
jgi:hypothetical protein